MEGGVGVMSTAVLLSSRKWKKKRGEMLHFFFYLDTIFLLIGEK